MARYIFFIVNVMENEVVEYFARFLRGGEMRKMHAVTINVRSLIPTSVLKEEMFVAVHIKISLMAYGVLPFAILTLLPATRPPPN